MTQPNNNNNNDPIVFHYSKSTEIPLNVSVSYNSRKYKYWGEDNQYPKFLYELYDSSPVHRGIVNGKTYYINGNGFKIDEAKASTSKQAIEQFLNSINPDYSANEILEQIILDLEIYGSFALELHFNDLTGKPVYTYYVDVAKLRISKDNMFYYYSNDWSKINQNESTGFTIIPKFNTKNRKGKSIIVYNETTKKEYSAPNYTASIASIKSDAEIQQYNLNVIENGFSVGTIISMNNGIPLGDEREKVEEKIKGKFTGSKGQTIMVTFSNGKDSAPTVSNLNDTNLHNRYIEMNKDVLEKIIVGHSVPSQALFGIKTQGQLGNVQELETAYKIFNAQYIKAKQNKITNIFNYILELKGLPKALYIEQTEDLFSTQTTDTTNTEDKSNTSNFSKEKSEDDLLKRLNEIGRNTNDYEVIRFTKQSFNDSETVKLSEIGLYQYFSNPNLLTDFNKRLLGVLSENQNATPKQLATILSTTVDKVTKALQFLLENEYLLPNNQLTSKGIEQRSIEDGDIQVMYTYGLRNGVTGSAVIDGTRDFCKKLLSENKLYTRNEIDLLSNEFGTDVWRYRGGWWNQGDRRTPSCRHAWNQVIVRKKK